MTEVSAWTAKRAGGRITISGKNAVSGEAVKIVGVDRIESGKPPVAIDKDGNKFKLV